LKYVRKKYKTKIEVVGDLCLPRDKENYLKFNLKRTVLNNLERKGMIQQKGNKYFINKKEFINQIIISMLGILNYSSERIKDALPMLSSSIILEKIIINFYRKYSEYNYIESHKDLAQLLITGLSSFSREKFFELEHKKSHNKRILSQDFELNLLQQTCWIYEGNKTRDSNKIINDIINNLISS
jgi:hypothetical protein